MLVVTSEDWSQVSVRHRARFCGQMSHFVLWEQPQARILHHIRDTLHILAWVWEVVIKGVESLGHLMSRIKKKAMEICMVAWTVPGLLRHVASFQILNRWDT